MRNYVKRTATTAADTINIMNPMPLRKRSSSTMAGREPAHWPRLDLYDEEQPKLEDGSVEMVVVSPFARRRLFCVDETSLLACGDQGRQDSPLRMITTWRIPLPVQCREVILYVVLSARHPWYLQPCEGLVQAPNQPTGLVTPNPSSVAYKSLYCV